MQLVPGWEKKPPGIDMSSLMESIVEPMFLYVCACFIRENIELAKSSGYCSSGFLAKVSRIYKLLEPEFRRFSMKPESRLMHAIFGEPAEDKGDGNYRQENLRDALMEVLDSIASSATGWSFRQRYKQVMLLRHGFMDGRARTLEEVGQEFGLSRERIRQIEAKALRLLRHPSRSNRLREFIIVKPRCGIG